MRSPSFSKQTEKSSTPAVQFCGEPRLTAGLAAGDITYSAVPGGLGRPLWLPAPGPPFPGILSSPVENICLSVTVRRLRGVRRTGAVAEDGAGKQADTGRPRGAGVASVGCAYTM